MESGEPLPTALEREIAEEIGIKINVDDEFFTTEHHYPSRSVRLHFFNCSIVEGEPRPIGVADLRWVDPVDLDSFEFPPADAALIRLLRSHS